MGNDDTLLLVIGLWDALKDLQSLHGSSASGGLVWDHAPDGLVKDARGSTEVEGT